MRMLAVSLAAVLSVLAPAALGQSKNAEPGQPAPDFTLKDVDGKPYKLSDYKGKVVVLEWFNPDCPYVRASHTEGSLVGLAKKHAADGVVWLAVNSGAPGRQGAGAERNRTAQKQYSLEHPVLLDEGGEVGRLYGATNTPHMYVITKDGKLAYRGAIDNSPDGEGRSPEGGKLVNYVEQALEDVAAGKPVRMPMTRAYGCSVKFKS
jgi:peroxiredoxin